MWGCSGLYDHYRENKYGDFCSRLSMTLPSSRSYAITSQANAYLHEYSIFLHALHITTERLQRSWIPALKTRLGCLGRWIIQAICWDLRGCCLIERQNSYWFFDYYSITILIISVRKTFSTKPIGQPRQFTPFAASLRVIGKLLCLRISSHW